MGGQIAKFAFQPPEKDRSARYLEHHCKGQVQFVMSADGEKIAFMSFKPNPSAGAASGLTTAQAKENSKYTILFCHGNAEDLAHSHGAFQDLSNKIGCDVVGFDYPGYSMSSGTPSEGGALAAGDAILDYLLSKVGIARDRVIVVGRSLGSGIATDLASKNRGLGGLVLVSPLKSACAVASSTVSILLYPVDIFPNIRKIGKVTDFPIMIFHGDRDTVVPYQHGVDLKDEAVSNGNSFTFFVPLLGAGHNDIEILRGREYFSNFRDFVAQSETRRAEMKSMSQEDKENASGSGCFSSCAPSSASSVHRH